MPATPESTATREHTAALTPLQPFLNDAVIVLRAPTQVWSGRDGDLGEASIHGI